MPKSKTTSLPKELVAASVAVAWVFAVLLTATTLFRVVVPDLIDLDSFVAVPLAAVTSVAGVFVIALMGVVGSAQVSSILRK